MTPDQVINIVLVYGVPNFPEGKVQPVGQWAAVYEGSGRWRIQGYVSMGRLTWETTWSYTNNQVVLTKRTIMIGTK